MTVDTYSYRSEGTVAGVEYVTVLDSGHNPVEYSIPLAEAEERYGRKSSDDAAVERTQEDT